CIGVLLMRAGSCSANDRPNIYLSLDSANVKRMPAKNVRPMDGNDPQVLVRSELTDFEILESGERNTFEIPINHRQRTSRMFSVNIFATHPSMALFLRLPPLGLQPLFDFRPAWFGFLSLFRPLAGLSNQRRQPL